MLSAYVNVKHAATAIYRCTLKYGNAFVHHKYALTTSNNNDICMASKYDICISS